ncbi:hypothetical protein CAOG_000795 [Capsaspora owczarzaki ATCC 30864]|uniref:Uncharacterized protein n=2 Tax=Capsaspora owczarzaki (strain ATCC 30864) TaxID=595528 RepID=A0A0D2WHW1_CAPO3|nr:hypothetical protein CAOG_000795 [Capsaspora owczarzaki ATCC 30864]
MLRRHREAASKASSPTKTNSSSSSSSNSNSSSSNSSNTTSAVTAAAVATPGHVPPSHVELAPSSSHSALQGRPAAANQRAAVVDSSSASNASSTRHDELGAIALPNHRPDAHQSALVQLDTQALVHNPHPVQPAPAAFVRVPTLAHRHESVGNGEPISASSKAPVHRALQFGQAPNSAALPLPAPSRSLIDTSKPVPSTSSTSTEASPIPILTPAAQQPAQVAPPANTPPNGLGQPSPPATVAQPSVQQPPAFAMPHLHLARAHTPTEELVARAPASSFPSPAALALNATTLVREQERDRGRTASRDVILERLAKENMSLSHKLVQQYQVDDDLKRLLVASVANQFQTEVSKLVEEKSTLTLHSQRLVERLQADAEDIDELLNEVTLWQTKFQASRVAYTEAEQERTALHRLSHGARAALSQMLQEREAAQDALVQANCLLACLVQKPDEDSRRSQYSLSALNKRSGVELAAMTLELVQTLGRQLYSVGAIGSDAEWRYKQLALASTSDKQQDRSARSGPGLSLGEMAAVQVLRSYSAINPHSVLSSALMGTPSAAFHHAAAATDAADAAAGREDATDIGHVHVATPSNHFDSATPISLGVSNLINSAEEDYSPALERVTTLMRERTSTMPSNSSQLLDCCKACRGPIIHL